MAVNKPTTLALVHTICEFMNDQTNAATGFVLGMALAAKFPEIGDLIREEVVGTHMEISNGYDARVQNRLRELLSEFDDVATLLINGADDNEMTDWLLSKAMRDAEQARNELLGENGIPDLTEKDRETFQRLIDRVFDDAEN